MNILRTHHVAVICSDYERSKAFYTEILGLEVVREVYRAGTPLVQARPRLPDGTQIELFSFPDPPKPPELSRGVRAAAPGVRGGRPRRGRPGAGRAGVVVEPVRVDEHTGKRFTFFADPDGLPLELYER